MPRSVFAVLSLLILNDAGMAQSRHGASGWAQIDHLEYGHHFPRGTIYLPGQAQVFHPPDSTTKSDEGWLNQKGTPVRIGTVEFYFDFSFHLEPTPKKEDQTASLILNKGLPSFGWNLETPMSWQALPELTKPLMEEEAYEIITPRPQIIGYRGGCGNDLITALKLEQQKLIDDSMWRAVRDMPKSIKDALIEDVERRSGKAFMKPIEPRWIWFSEMQEIHSKKGTATKIIVPAGPKLIRVTGNNPSEIYGTLDAGGDAIYLINPKGIFMGPGSRIK